MRHTTTALAATAFAALTAFGTASAGGKRVAPPFSFVESQAPKKTLFWDVDESGDPYRIASFEQVGRFSGTVKLPMNDLGPTYRRLNPAARFILTIGDVQYSGRLSDSNYVEGRPSATFAVGPGDEDPDTGDVGPPWVKARVAWSRKRVTVSIVGRRSVFLGSPADQNAEVDETRPMTVAFYGVAADLDVHVKGTVRSRSIVDGFGIQIPLTTVKLRGTGVVRAQ